MLGIRRGNAFRHVAPHHAAQPRAREGAGGRGRGREAGADAQGEPPVLATVASRGEGIVELAAALDSHYAYLEASGRLAERRRQRLAARTRAVLSRAVQRWLVEATRAEELLAERLDEVVAGRRSPYDVAAGILGQVKGGAGPRGGTTRKPATHRAAPAGSPPPHNAGQPGGF